MRFLACLLLLFVWDYASGKLYTVSDCGKRTAAQGRIYGGTVSKAGAYPWAVSIHEEGDHICGGTIINENWILTAGHCFNRSVPLKDYAVYAGLHKQSQIKNKKDKTFQKRGLSKIVIHDLYKDEELTHDVALAKLAQPLNIKGSKGLINGICLPPSASNPTGSGTAVGWGLLKANGTTPDAMMEITVPIIKWEECKKIFNHPNSEYEVKIAPTMLCAGARGLDTCEGDSGGPFFQFDNKGIATLIGSIANGVECVTGSHFYPGVFMKITAFKSWMERVMD